MRWAKGKNLASYSGHTFNYNAAGLRTTKTVGDIQTTYYLDGNKILVEERRYKSSGNPIDALYFHYGFDGVTGFEYRKPGESNKTYVYNKNIQGDITHIYTQDGKLVTEYIYDAWGNHNVCADEPCSNIACRNPFRYRAYYYDAAINLYYLQSRYYDPEVGRWINADDISELDPESINGLNLFSYCANNPVMCSDRTGCSPWFDWFAGILTGILSVGAIIAGGILMATGIGAPIGAVLMGAGIGMAIGGAMGGITAAINGESIGAGIFGGALVGGVIGATGALGGLVGTGVLAGGAAGVAFGVGVGASFLAGMGRYTLNTLANGKEFNVGKMFLDGGLTALEGAISFGMGAAFAGGGIWKGMNMLKKGSNIISKVAYAGGGGKVMSYALTAIRVYFTNVFAKGFTLPFRFAFL